jgi:tRNA (cmo5U34)-methyltransferase
MSAFDQARAANYDQQADAAIIGHSALYDVVMTMLAGHPMQRVLVLGAGTGTETIRLAQHYPDLEVIAVDPSEAMLKVAREKLALKGLKADVRVGVLEDFDDLTNLDAVVMIGVLHHLSDQAQQIAVLRELGKRTRPGGLLITGAQFGPMNDPLRRGAWEQRWRDFGISEDDIAVRREKIKDIVAVDTEPFKRWLVEFGFGHHERVFSSLFFEVWACLRDGPL